MTLVVKHDLDIVKMYVCTKKMKLLPLTVQKLQSEQIHRQTHTDSTEITTYPHMRMVITILFSGAM